MCHLLSWKITSRMKIDDHEDEVEKEHYQLADVGYAQVQVACRLG
jgi:hypothetical protein